MAEEADRKRQDLEGDGGKEPATASAGPEEEQAQAAAAANDDAVDDTEDLSDEYVQVQKQASENRRRESKEMSRIQKVLGFPFLPNMRPLTVSDLESCVALEEAAFANPAHRCTREKFEYRLKTCPELTLGIFCTITPDKAKGAAGISTLKTAHPVETGRLNGAVSVLFAHVIATRTATVVVTDAAMDYPRDFRTAPQSGDGSGKTKSDLGHQEHGRTVALHSLAVHPKLQGCGLGKLIMTAYRQQVANAGMATRISLICQDYLVGYYQRLGYAALGPSRASFGGGGWFDMTMDLSPAAAAARDKKKAVAAAASVAAQTD